MRVLSNTMTPKYYGEFRDKVLNGEIPVSREIAKEMERIDDMIANPHFYFDPGAIDGYVKFCEKELTLTDGSDLKLLDSFKLWAEQLLGWFIYVPKTVYIPNEDGLGGRFENRRVIERLRQKQYLIVARGAAKSMYAHTIQAYFLSVHTATTHQIAVAPTMQMAEEILSPARTAIARARGPLYKFLTQGTHNNTSGSDANKVKLAATKRGIENHLTKSLLEIRPMSIDKLQGLRPYVSTVDEWLSGDVREDVIGAIEQGASKESGYLVIAISSEGTIRNGSGDSIKMELEKILNGEYYAPRTSIFWYKLDDVSEVADPDMWLKAQPNLGQTVSYETYAQEVERAENAPSTRNDTLAKRFGIPMEGYTHFFTYEETIPHRTREFWRMPCSVGVDLSQGDDFCAFTYLFPLPGGEFGVKTRSYVSSNTMYKLNSAMREKYNEFLEEKSLHVLEGDYLDMMEVYEDFMSFSDLMQYDILALGYDPYNAKDFIERYERENGSFHVVKVRQGAKTESVPLGELKALSENRKLIFDQDLMKFAMGNAIVMEDTNGNRKLLKKRQEAKIDNVSALMDSWVAYKANQDSFE